MNDLDETQYDDNNQHKLTMINSMLTVATASGHVVMEYSVCPHCNYPQYHAHTFAETLGCQHPECGKPFASKVPRPPQRGELQAKHWSTAVSLLHAAHKDQQAAELPPPTAAELQSLPPEAQLLVARLALQVRQHTLEKVAGMAKALTEVEE